MSRRARKARQLGAVDTDKQAKAAMLVALERMRKLIVSGQAQALLAVVSVGGSSPGDTFQNTVTIIGRSEHVVTACATDLAVEVLNATDGKHVCPACEQEELN